MKAIVLQIAETFGEDCEVVLHDLRHPKNSVIMVANGHVTGRKVGQTFRDLVNVIKSPKFEEDHLSNYSMRTEDGKVLKCSTSLVRDENREVIGAICINYDLGKIMMSQKAFHDFCETVSLEEELEQDDLKEDVQQIMKKIVTTVVNESGVPVSHMQKNDKLDVVKFLDEKVFSIYYIYKNICMFWCI